MEIIIYVYCISLIAPIILSIIFSKMFKKSMTVKDLLIIIGFGLVPVANIAVTIIILYEFIDRFLDTSLFYKKFREKFITFLDKKIF